MLGIHPILLSFYCSYHYLYYHILFSTSNVLCPLDHSRGKMASHPLTALALLLPCPDTLLLPDASQPSAPRLPHVSPLLTALSMASPLVSTVICQSPPSGAIINELVYSGPQTGAHASFNWIAQCFKIPRVPHETRFFTSLEKLQTLATPGQQPYMAPNELRLLP